MSEWKADLQDPFFVYALDDNGHNKFWLKVNQGTASREELQAIANMVKAAPEMLAAMKDARNAWLHEAAQGDGILEEHVSILEKVDAAIAKAEGRTE